MLPPAAHCEGVQRRLLLIGESPMAGVGVDRFQQSFGAQLALQLNQVTGIGFRWQAIAENGARMRHLARLSATADAADLSVLACGVNDVLAMTSISAWLHACRTLVQQRLQRGDRHLLICGVPAIEGFSALPLTLAATLGQRARLLNRALAFLAQDDERTHWVETPALSDPRWLAVDGFHPSALGAAAWAKHCVDWMQREKWWVVLDSNQRPAD